MLIRLTPNAAVVSMGDMKASNAVGKLTARGIRTMADLDLWIAKNPRIVVRGPHKGDRYLMSRYQALKEIAGEGAADAIMNNLAIERCF